MVAKSLDTKAAQTDRTDGASGTGRNLFSKHFVGVMILVVYSDLYYIGSLTTKIAPKVKCCYPVGRLTG